MKLRFILNPQSGLPRRRSALLRLVRDFIAERGLVGTLDITDGPGHATTLARDAVAGGCIRVVAIGGDGTMNEVAQALLHSPAALGLVGCGSGNGLARHLGLPTSPQAALALGADAAARIRVLDTGTANGRPFFNVMGLGLDAEVSRRFNSLTRRGLPAYIRTALAAFARHRPEACTIAAGGEPEAFEAMLIAVANSDQYGNGAVIAPGARTDDGVLDLIAVGPVGYVRGAALTARLFLNSFDRDARVRRFRGGNFRITRPGPGLIHTDGELHATDAAIEIAIAPASLRVASPVLSPS